MSMMVSFVLSFFPRDVLDEILKLIESVSEDFPSYSCCRKQHEFIRGNSEVFLFCLSILSADKTSKKIDRYLVNRQAAI